MTIAIAVFFALCVFGAYKFWVFIKDQDKYMTYFVHPSEYEAVRQKMCSVSPQMESAVKPDPNVKPGTGVYRHGRQLAPGGKQFQLSEWGIDTNVRRQ